MALHHLDNIYDDAPCIKKFLAQLYSARWWGIAGQARNDGKLSSFWRMPESPNSKKTLCQLIMRSL